MTYNKMEDTLLILAFLISLFHFLSIQGVFIAFKIARFSTTLCVPEAFCHKKIVAPLRCLGLMQRIYGTREKWLANTTEAEHAKLHSEGLEIFAR